MEVLMDYHLVFIVIAFVLLLISVMFLFVDPTRQKAIASMLISGINYLLCLINSLAFFRIGLTGYTGEGTSVVTALEDMQPLYILFFLLHLVNVGFLFYAFYVLNKDNFGEPIKE